MHCEETQDLLSGYMDGELDVVRSVDIERHLQECQMCSQAYNNQQALRSAIRTGALYFTPPMSLQKRIRSAVRRASRAETRAAMWMWRWLSAAAALAFVVVVAWPLLSVLYGPGTDDRLMEEIISGHVRSLMAQHLTDVSSSDQHTVKPWFDGKLDFSPPVKDLADHGFSLLGGRLDYLGNRPVAALIYQRQQHVINLFLWPARHDVGIGETTVLRQGYNLRHWTQSGMTYWAISNLNKDALQEFVQLVQQQASLATSP